MHPDLSIGDLIAELKDTQAEIARLHKTIEGGNMLIMACIERICGQIFLTPAELERICQTYYLTQTPQDGGLWIRLYHQGAK